MGFPQIQFAFPFFPLRQDTITDKLALLQSHAYHPALYKGGYRDVQYHSKVDTLIHAKITGTLVIFQRIRTTKQGRGTPSFWLLCIYDINASQRLKMIIQCFISRLDLLLEVKVLRLCLLKICIFMSPSVFTHCNEGKFY